MAIDKNQQNVNEQIGWRSKIKLGKQSQEEDAGWRKYVKNNIRKNLATSVNTENKGNDLGSLYKVNDSSNKLSNESLYKNPIVDNEIKSDKVLYENKPNNNKNKSLGNLYSNDFKDNVLENINIYSSDKQPKKENDIFDKLYNNTDSDNKLEKIQLNDNPISNNKLKDEKIYDNINSNNKLEKIQLNDNPSSNNRLKDEKLYDNASSNNKLKDEKLYDNKTKDELISDVIKNLGDVDNNVKKAVIEKLNSLYQVEEKPKINPRNAILFENKNVDNKLKSDNIYSSDEKVEKNDNKLQENIYDQKVIKSMDEAIELRKKNLKNR